MLLHPSRAHNRGGIHDTARLLPQECRRQLVRPAGRPAAFRQVHQPPCIFDTSSRAADTEGCLCMHIALSFCTRAVQAMP